MNSTALIGALVGSFVTLAIALLNNIFGKKKNAAETESINVKTALELNAGLSKEVGELRGILSVERQRLAAVERRERLRNKGEIRHELWDHRAVETLRQHGIFLEDPPPLGADSDDPDGPRTRAEDFGIPAARPLGDTHDRRDHT